MLFLLTQVWIKNFSIKLIRIQKESVKKKFFFNFKETFPEYYLKYVKSWESICQAGKHTD